jgi:hypothetical protein
MNPLPYIIYFEDKESAVRATPSKISGYYSYNHNINPYIIKRNLSHSADIKKPASSDAGF